MSNFYSRPQATAALRVIRSLALAGRGGLPQAAALAGASYGEGSDVAIMLRAASTAGSLLPGDAWGHDLALRDRVMGELFSVATEPSITSRLTAARRIPLARRVTGALAGTTAHWPGHGQPKPLSRMTLEDVELPATKCVASVAMSSELLKMGDSSTEAYMRRELSRAVSEALDAAFLDYTNAGVADVLPPGIGFGSTSIASSGDPSEDLANLIDAFGGNLADAIFVGHPVQAARLGLWRDSGGGLMFPDMGPRGGQLLGLPFATTRAVVLDTDAAGPIHLIDAGGLVLGNGTIEVDVATHASMEFESDPDDVQNGDTVMQSLWQRNLTAVRGEIAMNWKRVRPESVVVLTGASYRVQS